MTNAGKEEEDDIFKLGSEGWEAKREGKGRTWRDQSVKDMTN